MTTLRPVVTMVSPRPWRVARPIIESSCMQSRACVSAHIVCSSMAAWQAAQVSVRMAGTAGRSTSDSSDAQQLYEAADATKEAAEADNLLDTLEIERSALTYLQDTVGYCTVERICIWSPRHSA